MTTSYYIRATIVLAASLGSLMVQGCGPVSEHEQGSSGLMATSISNPRPVNDISDYLAAATYARSAGYLKDATGYQPGDEVYYAISYGAAGAETGQGRGVLVEGENGGLFFRQTGNPTTQLTLAPGRPFNNGSNGTSLWEFRQYQQLINRIAFAGNTYQGRSPAHWQQPVYSQMGARKVDFRGGTAGRETNYRDVLEIRLSATNPDRSTTNVKIYYAKGIGPISLEFTETGAVGGSFRMYVNRGKTGGLSIR